MATYLELKAQAEKLLEKAEEQRKKELEDVIADLKKKIEEYGITANDLGFTVATTRKARKTKTSTSNTVAKYKNEKGDTWTGLGRMPNWMKEAIDAGKTREDFEIKTETESEEVEQK